MSLEDLLLLMKPMFDSTLVVKYVHRFYFNHTKQFVEEGE